MKTSIHNIKTSVLSLLLFSFLITNAQVIYEDQLETVYLNNQTEEVVYTNNFSDFNSELIEKEYINFRIEIKKAKENPEVLLFLSERSNLEILSIVYLKTIRKGANLSSDVQSFKDFLNENLPELLHQFKKDNNLEELYFLTRKNTFNGKIDALPSVL
ncbi:hypothetical protein [Aquimarina sp. MMG016]|uniref:hypothetical protein n=1 Tax=Aquimarina sp. MMG016 TaxID=2822690 RepID=UPI001B3A2607|nr:hypothetical protein [Aquimarina sp. MMG016]MBQ4822243.1 hypothetical protein [Aquimarina sp. MMG016]